MIERKADRRKNRTRFFPSDVWNKGEAERDEKKKREKKKGEREREKKWNEFARTVLEEMNNNSSGVVPGDDLQSVAATKQSKCIKDTNSPVVVGWLWSEARFRDDSDTRGKLGQVQFSYPGRTCVAAPPRFRNTHKAPVSRFDRVDTFIYRPFPAKFRIFSLSLSLVSSFFFF